MLPSRHFFRRLFSILGFLFLVVLLTVLTQVGGLILLLSWPLLHRIRKRATRRRWRLLLPPLVFLGLYLPLITLVVPPLARLGGRVPLPVMAEPGLRPLHIWTCLANRHYVSPRMRATMLDLAKQAESDDPGTVLAYMDGQFPFFKFSLPPHITHNDGRKLDVAFLYKDATTGAPLHRKALTGIGYGGSVDPLPGEPDRPGECARRGFRIYNWMSRNFPRAGGDSRSLDAGRTKRFLRRVLRHPDVVRIYLEPHLVHRFKLPGSKIGLASCASVRHDDHVHIQVR